MTLDLDKVQYTSTLPSFRNGDSSSFTVTVSGTVGAGATATKGSGSAVFAKATRMVRYSMQQDIVPSIAQYTSSNRVPLAIMVGGSSFSPFIGCSVAGSPSVTEIAPNIYITSTTTGVSVSVDINNPFAGTMTLTTTVLTIYYTAFDIYGE